MSQVCETAAAVGGIRTTSPPEPAIDDHRGELLGQELLATTLLWGNELLSTSAGGYAVIGVHWPGLAAAEANALLHDAFQACGGRGVAAALSGDDCYVLVPAQDEARATGLCRQVHDLLGGALWFAVSWRVPPEVSEGRQEVHSVLSLVRYREPGVYRLDDVLLDYAVLQNPAVAGSFVELITPILCHETLLATLEALIAANGNRSKVAVSLQIHRSTLEQRLQRIEQLTGYQPGTGRGLQALATALIACKTVKSGVGVHIAVALGQ